MLRRRRSILLGLECNDISKFFIEALLNAELPGQERDR